MASYNKIVLMGNLTRDPQLKYLPSGTAVCEFGLATNRKWTDQATGQVREQVNFIDCQLMGKQADLFSRTMTKGRPVLVEGRLDLRQWTTPNGEKRSKHEVFVEDFRFVGAPQGAGEGEGGGGGGYRGGSRDGGGPGMRAGNAAAQGGGDMGPPPDMGGPGPGDDVPF